MEWIAYTEECNWKAIENQNTSTLFWNMIAACVHTVIIATQLRPLGQF